jgi:hypothetical protein
LQEEASAARGNIEPVKVRSNNRARGIVADLNRIVAAFRGVRLAGEPQTFAGIPIYDANKLSSVHGTREEHGVPGRIESLKGDDFNVATDQLGLSFRMN